MKKTLLLSLLAAFVLCTCREIDSVLPNRPPVANAGDDASVISGALVNLDGTLSTDPDDDSLAYEWSVITRPAGSVASITHPDSVHASFQPDRNGQFKIRLVVSDNVETSADTITVTALKGNGPPVVNAGNDAQVDLGTQHALSGTASDPDGDPLTITWSLVSKPSGSAATIQNASSLNALIVIDKHGTYTAKLTVSDGTFSVSDNVVITTKAVTVTSINPTSGKHSITVKINGKNFSSTPGENIVAFNGVAATVTAATFTSLDATVPKGAGTGPVTVKVNAITATGPVFTYILTAVVSSSSQFDSPLSMAEDASGNIYISDYNSHVIRKLTPQGQLTILAGTGKAGYVDGKLADAQFNRPAGIAIDANNNIFVADNNNHCIRKISLTNGLVTTFAGFNLAGYQDAIGGQALFNSPIGLAIDASANLYVGDSGNGRIRKITSGAVVTTLAGSGQAGFADGTGAAAIFNGITGVGVSGNIIYVADALNNRIRKVTTAGVVTTLAGNATAGFVNGTGTAARFNLPYDVDCDANGNVFVADFNNHSIRRITPAGVVTTIAGDGTAGLVEGANARFNQPTGVLVHTDGTIHVADFNNQRLRVITFE